MSGAITHTIFLEIAKENDIYVIIKTRNGAVSGKIEQVHSEGVLLKTADDIYFGIAFDDIENGRYKITS